jgi:hypothetical protein
MTQTAKPETLQERLRMTHLEGDIDELKERVAASVSVPEAAGDAPPDEETWTFPFSYTDARGQVWAGTFTNEILDLEKQGYVANLRSRLQGGQPQDSIDPSIIELNLAIAWLAYSLVGKKPDWAKNLRKIKDPEVVMSLYVKARAHEDRYFRRTANPSASESSE